MPTYDWPEAQKRSVIGQRLSRVDAPDKSSGRAKYTFDANPPGLLFSKVLSSPYAHCRVKSMDTSAAEKMPGVKAVEILQGPGKEIFWAGDDLVAVAATTEDQARDAVRAIQVEYEVLPHFVDDETEPGKVEPDTSPLTPDDVIGMFTNQVPEEEMITAIRTRGVTFPPGPFADEAAKQNAPKAVLDALRGAQVKPPDNRPKSPYKQQNAKVQGNPDGAFADPEVTISEGLYGVPVITHCCLESHGAVAEWTDGEHLDVQVSTQNVSGIPGQLATLVGIPASNIHMHQQHVGGGFGSKFSPDRWTVAAAQLSKKADRKPVKLMLERAQEL
ncbi:MAG TPA: molybdopterin cofactor-binding domain-containing protein, partial [Terriglobales bacterium]|nr:molybdopterin cofactor-binding domain-containing protein [Terriglobales bacterium]